MARPAGPSGPPKRSAIAVHNRRAVRPARIVAPNPAAAPVSLEDMTSLDPQAVLWPEVGHNVHVEKSDPVRNPFESIRA